MWNLGNRGVLTLISALSGCAFLYKIWGPILLLAASLLLVIYVCYSLIVNDSPLSPHAFILFEYIREAFIEAYTTLQEFLSRASQYVRSSWQIVNQRCLQRFGSTMERPRKSHYQLSTDSYSLTKDSPRFSSIARLSPIPRTNHKIQHNDSGSENKFCQDSLSSTYHQSTFPKHSPISAMSREKASANGECDFFTSSHISAKKVESSYLHNQTPISNDYGTRATPDTSPWGANTSPKMRHKAGGMKTVQTVAGPLLASTRYNIDPKVYNDVTSPGLTTRLTKYATEANTKLTHQSQYGAGQFPRVNLYASPVPLISPKTAKMRSPVTVRVAPPDTTRYSPPGRQKLLSNICQGENKSSANVVQVLKEISLKRHASREDVASELPKKQRTENVICEEFEPIDEAKQKRSRDESSKSEEEMSPQNKTVRPAKRSKTPSCYDIINSLSSSIHVASGVKRKAIDFSRSTTPQFEKHFKSLDNTQSVEAISAGSKNSRSIERVMKNADSPTHYNKPQDHTPIKGILKTSKNTITAESPKATNASPRGNRVQTTGSIPPNDSVKLTDKLFMRAEPERNVKLKLLAEEQHSIKPKFTTDDVEEIKKADIVNMRQTSMKARLQSMFDAISGKSTSRINPDVVIEAEEISAPKATASPVTCATLNSSTTTTHVNTTPISTSAVAPVLSVAEKQGQPSNQAVFATAPLRSSPSLSTSTTSIANTKTTQFSSNLNATAATTPSTTAITSSTKTSAPSSTLSSPSFNAGSLPTTTTTLPRITTSSTGFTFGTSTSSANNFAMPSPIVSKATTTSTMQLKSTTTPTTTQSLVPGTSIANVVNVQSSPQSIIVPPSTGYTYTFGSKAGPPSITAATKSATPTTSTISAPSFKTTTNEVSTPAATSSSAPTPMFSFGSKTTNVPSTKTEVVAFGSTAPTTTATTFGTPNSIIQSSTSTIATPASSATGQPTTAPSTFGSGFGNIKSTAPTFGASTTSTFSFGTATSSATTAKPVFGFGAAPTSVISTASGASNTITTTTSTVGASVTSTTSATSSTSLTFGATVAKAPPQFGSTATGTSIFGSTTNAPTFGAPSGQSIFGAAASSGTTSAFGTPSTSAPAVNFGVPSAPGTTATLAAPATTATTNTFGAPSASATPSTFGAPAAPGTTGTFGAPSALGTASAFGTPATSATPSAFGVAASSGTGSAFSIPKTTASLFSSNMTNAATTAATTTTSTPIFGSTISSGTPTTTSSGPIFGAAINAPSGITTSSTNLFSNVNTNPSTPATTTSGFGETSSIFGQAKPAMTFGANTGGFGSGSTLFGGQTTAAPTFGAPTVTNTVATPTFGAPTVTNTVATPTFGATNTPAPAFGSIASRENQNTSTPGFGATPSLFGNNNQAPTFGATAGGFNAPAASGFGAQSPTSSSSFGTVASPGGFGDNKSSIFGTAAAAPSTFGAPTTTAPAFGTNTNTNTGIFTFGASQQKPAQQSSTFIFGSNTTNTNNPASNSTPFQFGSTAAKPAGFSFNAPPATPTLNFGASSTGTFNAPTPGMFSIGSGSTAPRSRSVRNRKPK